MKKLYDTNGYIKIGLIKEILEKAKRKGELRGVQSYKIKYFIESLEEELEKFKLRVGDKINKKEMEFLFKRLKHEKHDKIFDSELEEISKILLDEDFYI